MFEWIQKYKGTRLPELLFIVLSVFSCFFIFLNTGDRYDLSVLTIFFLIAIFSLYGALISIDIRSFSLNKSFCLFFYFFFSLAPALQFKNKVSFFISVYLPNEVYIKSGLILLSILLFYLILYHIGVKYLRKNKFLSIKFRVQPDERFKDSLFVMYLLVVLSFVGFMYLMKWDWILLVYRPFQYRLKYNTNLGLVGYSILLIIRLIPFIVLLYYKIQNERNNKHTYFFLTMLLLICFPTSLSRGILAIVYIPLLILFFPILKRSVNYVVLFMTGILFVFPLFNNFRYLKEGIFQYNFDLFNSGHFDAFQNFSLLINEGIVTNGRQFLGSILFFVQESQWVNRPNGTGHLLGETIGYSYLNVCMPFFGEGYANWGYVGIVVFLIVIVFLNVFFDEMLDKIKLKRWTYCLFFIFLGFEFYLLRGDLMSSIKIFTSFAIAILIVEILRNSFKSKKILN